MMRPLFILAILAAALSFAQQEHSHPAPQKLGTVSFPISCSPATQQPFNRAVALLHSFAYGAAEQAFQNVATRDPHCAIAHWGIAMTHFHELWDPPLNPAGTSIARQQLALAESLDEASARERAFIHALTQIFNNASTVPYTTRASRYEAAMHELAVTYPKDVEAQVFYALALLANTSPLDKTHRKQKQAIALLEPLYRNFPDHPGIPHYLIHACDSQELAPRGLAAARAYSKIAPDAPHALHMPSHIFTRLGMWQDSIASNLAAEAAARQQGDTGEELHAMDYLVYAYLQGGRDQEAAQVIQQLRAMQNLNLADFKSGYAATAMPIRFVVERRQWSDAETIPSPSASALPQAAAIAVWARGLGFAHTGHPREAHQESDTLLRIEQHLRSSGNSYWATQTMILRQEILAWSAQTEGKPDQAAAILRSAADEEDSVEKLPITPGPILPAREQLGDLLLQQGHPAAASKAFATALVNAPGRRGALQGAALAAAQSTGHSIRTGGFNAGMGGLPPLPQNENPRHPPRRVISTRFLTHTRTSIDSL